MAANARCRLAAITIPSTILNLPWRLRQVVLPGHDVAYSEIARQGFQPQAYPAALDRAGIDYMVVYPTAGLWYTQDPHLDAATAAAYRRAYNNWLHDFCSAAGPRALGAASIDLRDPAQAARRRAAASRSSASAR